MPSHINKYMLCNILFLFFRNINHNLSVTKVCIVNANIQIYALTFIITSMYFWEYWNIFPLTKIQRYIFGLKYFIQKNMISYISSPKNIQLKMKFMRYIVRLHDYVKHSLHQCMCDLYPSIVYPWPLFLINGII